MADVFISYSRRDKIFIARLTEALRETYEVWLDTRDIYSGTDWSQEIDDAIKYSPNFVFVVSPYSQKSLACNHELSLAISLNKRIIPVIRRESTQKLMQIVQEVPEDMQATVYENLRVIAAKQAFMMRRKPDCDCQYDDHNQLVNPECDEEPCDLDDFKTTLDRLVSEIGVDIEPYRLHMSFLKRAEAWNKQGKKTDFLLHGYEVDAAEAISDKIDRQAENNLLLMHYIQESRKHTDTLRVSQRQMVTLQTRSSDMLRFAGAAIGAGLSFGLAEYLIRPDNSLGSLAAQRFFSAIASGLISGVTLGSVILLATEFPLPFSWPDRFQKGKILLAWGASAVLCGLAFFIRHLMQRTFEPVAVDLLVLSVALFAAGFSLPAAFTRNPWIRALVAIVGVILALYLPQKLSESDAIYNFGSNLALPLSISCGFLTGLLTYMPDIYRDWKQTSN